MKNNSSKQKVLDAATQLFFQKGFDGTSVRDIAEKAGCNVSLISYYFKSKQGLLEYAVTYYYEAYLTLIESAVLKSESQGAVERLRCFVEHIIQYKQEHYEFSCFIHRELSLDSIFVREMAVTYIAKENHYLQKMLFDALPSSERNIDKSFLLLHLKGMLTTPYVLQNEWRHKVIGKSSHESFQRKYIEIIHQWIQFITEPSTIKEQARTNTPVTP